MDSDLNHANGLWDQMSRLTGEGGESGVVCVLLYTLKDEEEAEAKVSKVQYEVSKSYTRHKADRKGV